MTEHTKETTAWSELIQALALLARGRHNDDSPTLCSHDQLTVMADPSKFTLAELEQLEQWGFHPSTQDSTFYSFRFGAL